MSLYAVALFLHLLTVVAAFIAVALIHAGLIRMRRAERVGEAREALMSAGRAGRAMPIVGLLLLLTGAYMTESLWSWTTPWIDVSIGGLVAIMAAGGGLLERRLRALKPLLQHGDGPVDGTLAASLRAPSLWIIAQLPPLLAIGVMFVMTTKPGMAQGIIEILVVVAIGVLAMVPAMRVRERSEVVMEE
ncbi:MAG TPA: hypothetical protein VFW98_15825 [Gemmatimonadaceae bacterium]|nr:hypothetical protein [Gemmatimonadaceae bacterium]